MSSGRVGLSVVEEVSYDYILPGIYTRGGFSDVRVCHEHREYLIPENVLWDLFAEEYKRSHISQLEQMDADDVRAKLGIGEKR